MQTQTSTIAIAFMSCALIEYAINPRMEGMFMFLIATGLYAFLIWLEKEKKHQNEHLHAELEVIKNRMDSLSLAKGFNR